jgi:hypothetical protein
VGGNCVKYRGLGVYNVLHVHEHIYIYTYIYNYVQCKVATFGYGGCMCCILFW